MGRVLCGVSWHGPSWFWSELSVIPDCNRLTPGEAKESVRALFHDLNRFRKKIYILLFSCTQSEYTEKMENEFSGWSCETEVNLFHAMRGHKPVGMQNKEGLNGPNPP